MLKVVVEGCRARDPWSFPSPAAVSRHSRTPAMEPSSSKFFSAQTLPNRSKQEGIGRHRMPRSRNRIRLESQPVVAFEKSLGWISNPRVAGSIPAAPTIISNRLEANLTSSDCKLTASCDQLECKVARWPPVGPAAGLHALLPTILGGSRADGRQPNYFLFADHSGGCSVDQKIPHHFPARVLSQ